MSRDVADGRSRCEWAAGGDVLMRDYHDREWGVPVHDDRTHFEFLILEGAQAGLSWRTVLARRGGYRAAFAGFDVEAVARFGDEDRERLLGDAGIIRNRAKIASAVRNAAAFLELQAEHGSFDAYVWAFVGGEPRATPSRRSPSCRRRRSSRGRSAATCARAASTSSARRSATPTCRRPAS